MFPLQDILGFITSMNIAVKGKKTSAPCVTSSLTSSLLNMLDTISQWIDDIPPIDQPQRYGNKAFRDFYSRLKEVMYPETNLIHNSLIIQLDKYYIDTD